MALELRNILKRYFGDSSGLEADRPALWIRDDAIDRIFGRHRHGKKSRCLACSLTTRFPSITHI